MSFINEIQKTIDYIEENISKNLTLEDLSSLLYYSKFHYHRAFLAAVGEPACEYIRKRRLTNAVKQLIETEDKIIDIALNSGYSSQIAFTNALKKTYGITPGQLRKNRNLLTFHERIDLIGREFRKPNFAMTLGPEIRVENELKVVGLKYSTSMDYIPPNEVRILWKELDNRMPEIAGLINPQIKIGNCFYDENSNRLTYIACVEVNHSTNCPKGMTERIIPQSKYAFFMHRGTFNQNVCTLNYIFKTWLSVSEYKLNNNVGLVEKFDRNFTDCDDSLLEIGIGIDNKEKVYG